MTVFLLPFLILVRCMVLTTPLNEELFSRIIMLSAKRLEYQESGFVELNCSSSRQSVGNGAEFIVNGQTVEHISFHDNKCYNSKIKECSTDYCQCFPTENVYYHKYEYKNKNSELITGCQMRFADKETDSTIIAVISHKFNGTVSDMYEYDVRILKNDNKKNTDKNENNSSDDNISRWLPVFCGGLLAISAILIVLICVACRRRGCRRRQFPLKYEMRRRFLKNPYASNRRKKEAKKPKGALEEDITDNEQGKSLYDRKLAKLIHIDVMDNKIKGAILVIKQEIMSEDIHKEAEKEILQIDKRIEKAVIEITQKSEKSRL